MTSNPKKRSALGKGLGALLDNASTDITTSQTTSGLTGGVALLPVSSIEANPFNPRTNFEKEALAELTASIAIHGIIQPLTVRKLGRDKYQLISGERRFRASQMAGLTDECDLTQDQLSKKVSKSRSSITNHLRLLKLPAEIQLGVRDNIISMGHARALVSAGDEARQLELYRQVIDFQLSVREIEDMIRTGESKGTAEVPTLKQTTVGEITSVQEVFRHHLSDKISSKVEIKKTANGNGKIVINFSSEVDLNRIIELMNK